MQISQLLCSVFIRHFSRLVHTMEKFRLLIVDPQPIVEEGLGLLLEKDPDFSVIATASSCAGGLEELRRWDVDIVIMELSLPEFDGEEAIRTFLAEKPELEVIVYSAQDEEASVFRALKAGAKGYVLKSSPVSELVDAIREVHRGGYALSPSLNPAIIEYYLKNRDSEFDELAEYAQLTEREKQVFRLLADGKLTREIADTLFISPKTVAKHRAAVKKKLALKTSAEMAQYAIRHGILSVEGT